MPATLHPRRISLKVIYDNADELYYVVTAASPYSFYDYVTAWYSVDVRCGITSSHETKAEAIEQMRRLDCVQNKGARLETHHAFSDSRFEAVADEVYGCAWH